jgi:hypothetical protein
MKNISEKCLDHAQKIFGGFTRNLPKTSLVNVDTVPAVKFNFSKILPLFFFAFFEKNT